MALTQNITSTEATNAAQPVANDFDDGYLDIYSGTQPANASVPITTQVLLASLRFGNPAFGTITNGVASSNGITSDTDANATGAATWFRCWKNDHTTAICDGSAGVGGSYNLNMDSASITQHDVVAVTSFVYIQNQTGCS